MKPKTTAIILLNIWAAAAVIDSNKPEWAWYATIAWFIVWLFIPVWEHED